MCKSGSVGAYIKECFILKRLKEMPGKNVNSKSLFGVIYRSERILGCNEWIDQLDDLLCKVVSRWDGMLLVSGDMNINLFDNRDRIVKRFTDLLQSFDLTQHITKATRTTSASKLLLTISSQTTQL